MKIKRLSVLFVCFFVLFCLFKINIADTDIWDDITSGNIESVKSFLLAKKVSVNEKNNVGETLLHIACKNGSIEMMKFLIENGADLDAKDSSGKTPFDVAVENGHGQLIMILLEDKFIQKM